MKRLFKKTVFVVILLVVLLGSIWQVRDRGSTEDETVLDTSVSKDGGEDLYGISIASDQSTYQNRLLELMETEADKLQMKLDIRYAAWDADLQNEHLNSFIRRKVKVIVVIPIDSKSILESLTEARRVGIPVVNLNMKVDSYSSSYISTYVGASSSEEGALSAELTRQLLPQGGKIGIIEGRTGTDPQIYRTQTYMQQLSQNTAYKVVMIRSADWDRDQARLVAMDMMHKIEDLNLIYCQDNTMAEGAADALREEGRDDICVIGIGEATEEFLDRVRQGDIDGFIAQDPEFEAISAIRAAYSLAKDRRRIRPWIQNPVQILRAENVDQYQKPEPYK